jgi:hypothetical protein
MNQGFPAAVERVQYGLEAPMNRNRWVRSGVELVPGGVPPSPP